MYIRKSMISKLILKEKQKVKISCEKQASIKIKKLQTQIITEYEDRIKELSEINYLLIKKKDREIKKLNKEIEQNRNHYISVRQRENSVDELSDEIEYVVNNMVLKVQETLQPFYRTRAKIEATKRASDKKHNKVESIFRAAK